nr:uncharacterized protein LOC109180246 [Ipomoea batatas]
MSIALQLEGLVEISSSSDSEASTANMDEHRAALRARAKTRAFAAEKGKAKAAALTSPDPNLVVRHPSTNMIIGASPMAASHASTQQPCRRTSSSKQASDSATPTTSKKAKRVVNANPNEGVVTTKANVFRWLDRAQLAHAGLHGAIKDLTKDSELLKSSKATHAKEVKGLKAEVAKLNASLTGAQESAKKLAEDLKLTLEDALKEFKESEVFHEEAMTHADLYAKEMVDKWLGGPVGKRFLLDPGEMPDPNRSTNPVSLKDDQGAEDVDANASADTAGGEISMDNAYLNSSANLDSVAGMDSTPVPTLAKDSQGDTITMEEEDPLATLQLNRRRSRSSECNPPTGPTEGEMVEVSQSEA